MTTEDPANGFLPDYGKIQTYRSPAGFGIRLDGASAYGGAVITPFYDSLLVKVTAWGREFPQACQRMDRALARIPHSRREDEHSVSRERRESRAFQAGGDTTSFLDETAGAVSIRAAPDRATRVLTLPGRSHRERKSRSCGQAQADAIRRRADARAHSGRAAGGHAATARRDWARRNSRSGRNQQKQLLITDTTFRDAHQSLMATRVRTYDMLAIANFVAHKLHNLYSLEMWGGATFDVVHALPAGRSLGAPATLREAIPNICFQMLFRASNAVGYSAYPDNVVEAFILESARQGIDIFRVFDSLNWLPNMKLADGGDAQDRTAFAKRPSATPATFSIRSATKYSLQYYVRLAKELEKMGAHILRIKDMAGLCKPVRGLETRHGAAR